MKNNLVIAVVVVAAVEVVVVADMVYIFMLEIKTISYVYSVYIISFSWHNESLRAISLVK